MSLNLDAGLRQPIEDLIARGYTGPWVVVCNSLAYASGTYQTELGQVIVHSTLFHTPVDDLTVMPWEVVRKEIEDEGISRGNLMKQIQNELAEMDAAHEALAAGEKLGEDTKAQRERFEVARLVMHIDLSTKLHFLLDTIAELRDWS